MGGTGNTATYTPSGNASPGTWSEDAVIPNGKAPQDAPAAVMPNGRILCAVGTQGYVTNKMGTNYSIYPAPTWFYEYDPIANSFNTM